MTDLPEPRPGARRLGLVIDLDTCVGCHGCATSCKEWNASGHSAPLPDFHPYSAGAEGVWFNRVHSYEAGESWPIFPPQARPPGLEPPPMDVRYGAEFRAERVRTRGEP